MQVHTTLEVARALRVPEWRLGRLVREGVIEAPPLVAGRRLWQARHVRAAEASLRRAGLLPPTHDPMDRAADLAAESAYENACTAGSDAAAAREVRT